MPELPEVETVRRQLARVLPGRDFVAVARIEPAMLWDCWPEEVKKALPGRRVLSVDRLGKFLLVPLSDDYFLTLHLGMTGQLLIVHDETESSEVLTRRSVATRLPIVTADSCSCLSERTGPHPLRVP